MSSVEHLDAPISKRPILGDGTEKIQHEGSAISLRLRMTGSSFFWPIQLLPAQRREAMYALYAFCRELHDIADGEVALFEADPVTKLARRDCSSL